MNYDINKMTLTKFQLFFVYKFINHRVKFLISAIFSAIFSSLRTFIKNYSGIRDILPGDAFQIIRQEGITGKKISSL